MNYHCKNREPPAKSALVQDGWQGWLRVMVPIQLSPPTHCQYAKDGYAAKDKMCNGCRWKKKGYGE